MGDLNWTKTSSASSLVRSEAFWCTQFLGPEAERQEGGKRGGGEGSAIDPGKPEIALDVPGIHERPALRMKVPINEDGEGMSHTRVISMLG